MIIKKGDCVVSFNQDEGMTDVGIVAEDPNSDGEIDLNDYEGGLRISPVMAEDCFIVPIGFAQMLDRLMENAPSDEDGYFLFNEDKE